ncbi:uncharacterized protein PITG_02390 [Phytophthora infestans T30-4]|uniref:Uncharacterized protein n=1 Tax=Phytophthora infestans (strain T30-4) TaxID=403677 RepID=D0MW74_PHYIT|nr:uncharacterized protein PITG_02390 [Phytophthora infestans T30-4]EEY63887.1 conserved hypothetical protein [Phytophthora infestans T30-4]|eukprot:XP_002907323.1 conserved hypothetical protein [Phytophthora infestans T30-4]
MERKNDILSEWASIEVFNMPDADPDQRAQFFKILRQKKLSEMMKKIADSKQSDDETSETYQVSAAETEIPEFDEASRVLEGITPTPISCNQSNLSFPGNLSLYSRPAKLKCRVLSVFAEQTASISSPAFA